MEIQLINKENKSTFKYQIKSSHFNCLDIAHGDETSKKHEDNNPYKWLSFFADKSPVIHLKQKIQNDFAHLSFTNKNNKKGIVNSQRVINQLKKSTLSEHELVLELSLKRGVL